MIVTTDMARLNEVANHPEVRPWLGGDGASPIDYTIAIERYPGTFAIVFECGGFVFVPHEGGELEFHTQFLPEGRGRIALDCAREAMAWLFSDGGWTALKTYVPHSNKAALGLVRLCGFERTHDDDANSYWCLKVEAWKARRLGVTV